MTTDKIPANQPDDEDEIAAEVTATNEGMPAGETDADPRDPKAVQAPEMVDPEKRRKSPSAPAGKNSEKNSEESKGAAAGE